ncbi:MAG: hypothetical protein WD749_14180 [Phycisphaerales bacterium]
MDQLRQLFAAIQKNLGAMGPSQRLLFGSLAVIMIMALFLVSQYAGKPLMVPLLPGASMEDQQKAAVILRTAGVRYTEGVSGLMVPTETREEAFALLGQSGSQPANTAVVFENILKTQNWMNSREQNRQLYRVMLNNWLSGVLSKFNGIKRAEVFVDAPEAAGIGQSARRPKASVTLFAEGNRAIPQEIVEAAARFVAGSVSGLDLGSVVVNDASAGRVRRVTGEDELLPTTYRDYATAVERQFKGKLESLLRHIDPPATVEVTANVDVSRVRSHVSKTLANGEGSATFVKKETSSSTTETQPVSAAEPGVRPNAMMDLNQGGARAGKSEQKTDETDFAVHAGTKVDQIDDPRGHPTRLVATVAVPRRYIVSLLQRETPVKEGEQPSEPERAKVDERWEKERAEIERSLKPHVITRTPEGQEVPGEVVVTLVSGEVYASNGFNAGPAGGNGGGGGGAPDGIGGTISTLMAGGNSAVVDKVVLGALSLVAVGMMFMLVRRSGRRADIPSAQEMVGRPPTLEAKSDLVGEADETETAMAGIIVGEDQIKAEKMREQVSDLVRQNPDSAAKLLNRWISVEE